MKLISRYSSEKPLYYAVFSPTEIHTSQPGHTICK